MNDCEHQDQQGTNERPDGRLERTTATRRRILDAARDLLIKGVAQPTAKEIADAASITTRTLFRHFNDMESLFQTLVEDAEREVMAVRDEAFAKDQREAGAQEMLETIIDRRCRVYETLLPLYVSRIWASHRASLPGNHRKDWLERGRTRLRQALPDAITKDETLFEAIDATLGIEYWVSLRRDQRLSARRARAVLERAVHQLTSQEH